MGSSFSSYDAVEGAYYMGANSGWEVIWTLVAVAVCVIALVAGSKHELESYKRVANGKK